MKQLKYNYDSVKEPQQERRINRSTSGFTFLPSKSSIDLAGAEQREALKFITHFTEGRVAQTSLFANANQSVKRVVKRPVFCTSYSQKVITVQIKSFEAERDNWNKFYPDQPAILVTDETRKDGGIRLILPWFPGKTYTEIASRDQLIRFRHLLAIASAFLALTRKGLYYSDFNADNVLLDENPDGSFKAYLIDFGGMQNSTSGHELAFLHNNLLGLKVDDKPTTVEEIQEIIIKLQNAISERHSCAKVATFNCLK